MQISIVNMGDDEYMFKFAGSFSGSYKRVGQKLIIDEPATPRFSGFIWKIKNPQTLILVAQPDQSKTGSDYMGAILKRFPQENKVMTQ